MRLAFFYIVAGTCTLVCILVCIAISILPRIGGVLGWIARDIWAPVWLWSAGVKVETSGHADVLDPSKPYVYVSNHQSYFDIPATYRSVPHKLRFVAKKELLYIPLVGFYIWRMGSPIVDRSNRERAVKTLDRAADKIRSGIPILVYAEGTRTRDGEVAAFKKGGFPLAIKAGVPIVPVTVDGSYDVMNRQSIAPKPGVIRVHVGAPISTDGLTLDDRHALSDRVRNEIVDQLAAMRA